MASIERIARRGNRAQVSPAKVHGGGSVTLLVSPGRQRGNLLHGLIRRRRPRRQADSQQHRDLVLYNEAFDRFIDELDKPAEPVPELVELFEKNPKFLDG